MSSCRELGFVTLLMSGADNVSGWSSRPEKRGAPPPSGWSGLDSPAPLSSWPPGLLLPLAVSPVEAVGWVGRFPCSTDSWRMSRVLWGTMALPDADFHSLGLPFPWPGPV